MRPLEAVAVSSEGLMKDKKLLPSSERYKEPWNSEPFTGSILFEVAQDAGGGSSKCIVNPVNVERPQSQRHVITILEFGGVKDSQYNVQEEAFKENDNFKKDLEVLMHRRCILLKFMIDGKLQTVVVKNTNKGHNRFAPKALPGNISGSEEHAPTQPLDNTPVKFEDRIVKIDVASIKLFKLLRNSITKMIDGFCFIDEDDNNMGQALFL